LYITSENGGGDIDHPQLRVYAPSTAVNAAPTAVALTNQVTSIDENTSTASRIKIADVNVTDDGLGTNHLYLTGPDAGFLEVDNTGLYIKAGTVLDYETKTSYTATVNVDDPSVGGNPDAVSSPFTLNVNNVVNENPGHPVLYISEVAPWSSGNSPVAADWFEVTNTGTTAVDITGWKMDDSSNAFGNAVALTGITSIAAGESVIFVETTGNTLDTVKSAFINTWFGGNAPAGLQVGGYGGSGVGLSTGGDAVNLYNAAGQLQAGVSFGSSAAGPFESFDNSQGLNNSTIADLSAVALHGAFAAANDGQEIGSPGTVGKVFISEVAPWASGNSPGMADWFEVTNSSAFAVDITGWKMDDNSQSFAAAAALSGITSIGAGESVIFIETSNLAAAKAGFLNTWFGSNPPPNLQIGSYSGSGVGLSTSSDAVNLYNASGVLEASVNFAASPAGPYPTFDNAAGLNNATISQLSANGVHGGFTAVNDALETGSPGGIAVVNAPPVASDDSLSNIAEDSGARSISFSSLLGNDKAGPANESAQALTIIAVGNAVGGSVAIQGSNVIFTPTADYNGPASFDYTVQDNGTSYGVSHFLTDVGTASFAITPVNDLPVITSPSGFFLPENHTAAGTVTATDGDHDALTFSLSGGADEALFTITGAGDLSFINPPDFETPLDAGHDNVYQVEVAANDGSGTLVTQLISVTVTDVAEAGLTVKGGNGDDVLNGTAGNDIVNAGNGADQIDAGDGSDNVSGGNGDDVIAAGHGDDTVNAGNNDDSVDGGLGNDNLGGSNGNDSLDGGDGNDSVDGGTGNDVLDGGTGNDILAGGNGTDLISAGDGDDSASGDDGNDVVNGDAGDDILAGGNGNDQLDGGTGNDTLSGEDGADKLSGGDGDDVLSGGNGKDVLTGGIGADIFVFGPPGVSGGDEVTDFLHGTDRLEFSAADLGLAAGTLDAADLVFGTKATDHHGEFVYNQVNGKLSWDADGVGGAAAVAVATLDTHDALDHADFLLI
ncbi:MAG TPA: lamin tail domain-containing protein, partial [Rhizomicrobium sp.]|nr:lamin tail domain-containing protein [Rhizomicrobium sp.]